MTPEQSIISIFQAGLKRKVGPMTDQDQRALLNVTEGRAAPGSASYGWCGDAITHALWLMGCCDPATINRISVKGVWTPGANITLLQKGAGLRSALLSPPWDRPWQQGYVFIKKAPSGNHVGVVAATVDPRSSTSFTSIDGNGTGHTYSTNPSRLVSDVLAVIVTSGLFNSLTLTDKWADPVYASAAFDLGYPAVAPPAFDKLTSQYGNLYPAQTGFVTTSGDASDD